MQIEWEKLTLYWQSSIWQCESTFKEKLLMLRGRDGFLLPILHYGGSRTWSTWLPIMLNWIFSLKSNRKHLVIERYLIASYHLCLGDVELSAVINEHRKRPHAMIWSQNLIGTKIFHPAPAPNFTSSQQDARMSGPVIVFHLISWRAGPQVLRSFPYRIAAISHPLLKWDLTRIEYHWRYLRTCQYIQE